MALSEHEQRMLDAIEQALFEDDLKFASRINQAKMRRRRPVLAAVLLGVGLVCLVVGVIATQGIFALGVTVSVLGFLTMVIAVGLLVYGQPGGGPLKVGRDNPRNTPNPLSERMEERLRRRFEGH